MAKVKSEVHVVDSPLCLHLISKKLTDQGLSTSKKFLIIISILFMGFTFGECGIDVKLLLLLCLVFSLKDGIVPINK